MNNRRPLRCLITFLFWKSCSGCCRENELGGKQCCWKRIAGDDCSHSGEKRWQLRPGLDQGMWEMDSSGHFPAKTISNAQEFPCEIQASRKAECLRPLLKLADFNMAVWIQVAILSLKRKYTTDLKGKMGQWFFWRSRPLKDEKKEQAKGEIAQGVILLYSYRVRLFPTTHSSKPKGPRTSKRKWGKSPWHKEERDNDVSSFWNLESWAAGVHTKFLWRSFCSTVTSGLLSASLKTVPRNKGAKKGLF